MAYTLRFFSSKCSLFHNSNVFGSRIIRILYTGCAKIKKNNSGAKRVIAAAATRLVQGVIPVSRMCNMHQRRESFNCSVQIYDLCASHLVL